MKKWFILLLTALLVMQCVMPLAAFAETEDGSIRHEVHGDRSELVVDEEAGEDKGQINDDRTEAKLGTDIYLFVDPDTASYVTFYVTDEQGRPIEDAQIYIIYNDIRELYGTTDEDGELKVYLFRDVEYEYEVHKKGYESVEGSFTATQETKKIRVVLRRYYPIEIIIVDKGQPQPNIPVIIDGETYYTDEDGRVIIYKTNGVYDIQVVTKDGRVVPVRVEVKDQGVTLVVDISQDDTLMPDGLLRDSFLVYDKHYNPEDYVLTKLDYMAADLTQGEEESQEDFDARTARYLESHPAAIVVEAQPDRTQLTDGTDRDKLDSQGNPIYSQRSMMPSGALLKYWEEEAYANVVFTNEKTGLHFALSDLNTGKMAKLYALIYELTDRKVDLEDIVTEEVARDRNKQRAANLTELTKENINKYLYRVDWDAIRDFEFEYQHQALEHKEKDHDLLPSSLYTNSLFEFRITPIRDTELRKMIRDGLGNKDAEPKYELILANWRYFQDEIRRYMADGRLNDEESQELYQFVVDGKLSAEELEKLHTAYKEKTLTDAAIDLLAEAALEEQLYRVSCWLMVKDVEVNITTLMDSLQLIRNMDEEYDRELAALREENQERQEPLEDEVLQQQAEDSLAEDYSFLLVDNQYPDYAERTYKPGDATTVAAAWLLRSVHREDCEFYQQLEDRRYAQLTVDVRLESIALEDGSNPYYRAVPTQGDTGLELHRALAAPLASGSLTALTAKAE